MVACSRKVVASAQISPGGSPVAAASSAGRGTHAGPAAAGGLPPLFALPPRRTMCKAARSMDPACESCQQFNEDNMMGCDSAIPFCNAWLPMTRSNF